jgi:hypothetical protein
MILSSEKQPKTISDVITSNGYTEPIWWNNVYNEKKKLKK